jgi:hypothetical protein
MGGEEDEGVEDSEGEFVDEEEDEEEGGGECVFIYRSSIWSNLEIAEMHRKAPQEEGSEDIEERFLITLV